MKGRKPKPIAVQIAEGDPRKRGKKKLLEAQSLEIQAERGLPACPNHLTGRARKTYEFFRAELEKMDLDRRPDVVMLEGAATAYALAVQADQAIEAEGLMLKTPILDREGEVVGHDTEIHPAIRVREKAWTTVRAFCSEFGLSPVSRMRLPQQQADDGTDELAQVLSQSREDRAQIVQ